MQGNKKERQQKTIHTCWEVNNVAIGHFFKKRQKNNNSQKNETKNKTGPTNQLISTEQPF